MGELLPECLNSVCPSTDEEGSKSSKQKHKSVSTIIEWVQGFRIYVAVLSRSQHGRISDLLNYPAGLLRLSGGWLAAAYPSISIIQEYNAINLF